MFLHSRGAGGVSYQNSNEGQSQEQRGKKGRLIVYQLTGKLEDYLQICSQTDGAGRDRTLAREIRGVPAVQKQAALE